MSSSRVPTTVLTTAPVAAPMGEAPKSPATGKRNVARKAAAVPSQAVIAKAAVRVKAAPNTAAHKTPAVKAPLLESAAKAAVKKPAPARPAAKPAARPVKGAAPVGKPRGVKKAKLVRDSFTLPKAEYMVLEELKQRASSLEQPVKKSELLRAGIKALATLSDTALRAVLKNVPAIKTGRPAGDK